ncbi:hypothetical protein FAVG1_00134 [Fusarium avenaceum]|nr:hypothetical protein FAVG1_00134 [Fusarium avenaceum]
MSLQTLEVTDILGDDWDVDRLEVEEDDKDEEEDGDKARRTTTTDNDKDEDEDGHVGDEKEIEFRGDEELRDDVARTMTTIATLKRLSAKSLSEKIIEEVNATDPTFAIIDVRDNDYIGGHIKGSTNIPAHTLEAMMPTLVRRLKDKKTVVFHCALSQQRGPTAALKYLRERDGLLRSMGEDPKGESGQDVLVLDRGFSGWQEVYGEDERLTEGYVKDLWENY